MAILFVHSNAGNVFGGIGLFILESLCIISLFVHHFFLWPLFGFVSRSFANELNIMIYWKMERGLTSNGRKKKIKKKSFFIIYGLT